MRKLFSVLVLSLTALPAFANIAVVPEPEVMSLLGMGALAFIAARRFKK
ncbi:MAG: PEP-CTERM sorting domain-containing protein [Methylomicrobium sp.]|nr:PEP-CTERM sorting domain-containing protein [Methylomicrobium sp.]